MSVANYFTNIKDTAASIFEGFSITLSHMMRKPVTIQYPDRTDVPVTDLLPERSRSFLRVEMDTCTACLLCEKSCPIDCIKITTDKDAELGRVLSGFDIDMAKCMYCGLCTEPCPTGAIHFIPTFERAAYSLEEMIERFVPENGKIVPYKVPKKEKGEGAGAAEAEESEAEPEAS